MRTINYFITGILFVALSFIGCENNEISPDNFIESNYYEIVSEKSDSNHVKRILHSYLNQEATRSSNLSNEILFSEYDFNVGFTTNKALYDGTLVKTYMSLDNSKILVYANYANADETVLFELMLDKIDDEYLYMTKYDLNRDYKETFQVSLDALSNNPLTAIKEVETRAFLGKNACDWAIYAAGAAWVAGAGMAAPTAGAGFLIGAGIGLGFDYMASKFCH